MIDIEIHQLIYPRAVLSKYSETVLQGTPWRLEIGPPDWCAPSLKVTDVGVALWNLLLGNTVGTRKSDFIVRVSLKSQDKFHCSPN